MNVIMVGANNPEVIRLIKAWSPDDYWLDDRNNVCFLDNDKSLQKKNFFGYRVLGGTELLGDLVHNFRADYRFVNLITGSTEERYRVTKIMLKAGCKFTNFIHPSVNQYMVHYGVGVYIQDHVIIQAGVEIGDDVSIHTGAIIAHECIIGAHSFIAHGACMSGKVEIGEGVFVGANATILPRLKIGKWAIIGAGAVVTKDVDEYSVVVGNPARVIR